MKPFVCTQWSRWLRVGISALFAWCLIAVPAHAGLTINIHLYHDNYGFFCFPFLSTNTVTPNNPSNSYFVTSTSGSLHGELDAGSAYPGASSGYFGTFDALTTEITNGTWSLVITNASSTNHYSYTVSVSGLNTNFYTAVVVTYPTNTAQFVTNQPVFTWQGPPAWAGTLHVEDDSIDTNGNSTYQASADLPGTQTAWASPMVLPGGTNQFNADYQSNATTLVIAAAPTNNASQTLAGWVSTATIETYYNSEFTIGTLLPTNNLVAHYTFDDPSNLGADSSGNGYNLDYNGNPQGAGVTSTSDSIAGAGSAYFDGGSVFGYSSTPPAVLSTLAGSFGVSFWVKTSDSDGNQNDYAFNGDGIITADVPGVANDLVPAALTGGQIAFNTGNTAGNYDDTINSVALVDDNSWHHVVVTRNQQTGEKDIYVDGALSASDFDTTAVLSDPQMITFGALSDASQSNPANGNYGQFYTGELDDVQLYSRFLVTNDVAFLYTNPGATLGGTAPPYPVNVDLALTVDRNQELDGSETYLSFPSFDSISPSSGTNFLTSPNGLFSSESDPSGGYSSSQIMGALGDVLNEWTNGVWTLYVNEYSSTQQVYTFSVSVTGLDTNFLRALKIINPANGSVNVPTSPAFYWVGPSTFTSLSVNVSGGAGANLSSTTTNWTSPQLLNYGTNQFYVNYSSNDYPNITFTTPVDSQMNPVSTWAAHLTPQSTGGSQFVVGANGPQAVHLVSVSHGGGSLQFSFDTVAGRPHTIQSRTNLSVGSWINITNFIGDGTVWQFKFAATNPPVRFFRVDTQ